MISYSFRPGASSATPSLPRLSISILAVIGGLAGSPAKAESYVLTDKATRGSVSVSGTSLGAFTLSPTFYAFQGVTTTTDLAIYEAGLAAANPSQTFYFSSEPLLVSRLRFADGLVDRFAPVGTLVSGEYPTGTGSLAEPLIEVDYYGPDANTDNTFTKRYLMDGGVSLSYRFQTLEVGAVRCNFVIAGVNPVDATTYSYTTSGLLTFGIDGADDLYSSTYVLRGPDNQLIVTGKTSGVASMIPEPSAYGLCLGLAATLSVLGVRHPRGSWPRA